MNGRHRSRQGSRSSSLTRQDLGDLWLSRARSDSRFTTVRHRAPVHRKIMLPCLEGVARVVRLIENGELLDMRAHCHATMRSEGACWMRDQGGVLPRGAGRAPARLCHRGGPQLCARMTRMSPEVQPTESSSAPVDRHRHPLTAPRQPATRRPAPRPRRKTNARPWPR